MAYQSTEKYIALMKILEKEKVHIMNDFYWSKYPFFRHLKKSKLNPKKSERKEIHIKAKRNERQIAEQINKTKCCGL